MRLPKLAIENYQFTLIVVILLVLSGFVSFLHMPRTEDPPVAKPGSTIVVIYPGATPSDMEQLVVTPLEEAINELEDIKRIESSCEDGLAVIQTEFHFGTDPDEKFSDINDKVNSTRDDLPADILRLQTIKWTIEDTNFMQAALVSDTADYRELEREAERLKRDLEKVSGVRRVKIWAFPEQQVRVSLDLERMAQNHIALKRVMGAIQSANVNIPGGTVDAGRKRFNIQTSGTFESIEEIKNTVVHTDGSRIVYLRDIADVVLGYEDNNYLARFNGDRALFITANQKIKTNVLSIIEAVEKNLKGFESSLPDSMKLSMVYNQAGGVRSRLNGFFSNLIQGMILVGLVILITIGLRGSFIVMLAIPISLFIAIGFVDLSGFGIQQMTIAGLVITLGLLVDNAIVVTENIARFIRLGEDRQAAAIKGTRQISWAIVSATATTVFAFLPIILMQDVSGEYIRSMPVTVIFTLAASLFIALTFTPFLSVKILRPKRDRRDTRFQGWLNEMIHTRYRRMLDRSLAHPRLVMAGALLVFLGSMALFPLVGVSFFPKAEKKQFFIDITAPEGTAIHHTDRVARDVEAVLRSREEVGLYAVNVGRSNPRIYYNIIEKQGKANFAHIFVKLKGTVNRREMGRMIRELRDRFAAYPGAKIEIKELEQGPPVQAPVEIKVRGRNIDVLKKISFDVEDMFTRTEGLININNPLATSKTDIRVRINRDKAAMLGIPLVDIDQSIRMAVAGLTISTYRDREGKEYDIVLRPGDEKRPGLDVFERIHITTASGVQVPLDHVAALSLKSSRVVINHFNLERSVTLTADVLAGFSVNDITRKVIAKLDRYQWPSGYNFHVGGEKEGQDESFGGMGRAVIIAIIAIFAVLVLQFKSFAQPLIVFSALPLAVIGSILALLVTGYSFSFTAFIGLTSLVGIVVNNSIILVDYSNQLRRDGRDILSAVKEAAEIRFTPIILTTATTIGGLLPLTLQGGTLWAPMGWTIIGGLLTSTLLTLFLVPVLYRMFTPNGSGREVASVSAES